MWGSVTLSILTQSEYMYGSLILTYNFHGILQYAEDVVRHGPHYQLLKLLVLNLSIQSSANSSNHEHIPLQSWLEDIM